MIVYRKKESDWLKQNLAPSVSWWPFILLLQQLYGLCSIILTEGIDFYDAEFILWLWSAQSCAKTDHGSSWHGTARFQPSES